MRKKFLLTLNFPTLNQDVYLEPRETSTMEFFCENIYASLHPKAQLKVNFSYSKNKFVKIQRILYLIIQ